MIKKNLRKLARPFYKFFQYRYYKSLVQKNRQLFHKYADHRLFILADGSPLNDLDLSLLSQEYTMGSNYLMVHKDFSKIHLKFYAVAASRRSIRPLVNYSAGNFHDKLKELDGLLAHESTQFFFDVSMKKYLNEKQIFKNKKVYFAVSGAGMRSDAVPELDLTKPLSSMEGSLPFMITLAMYMGFKEIYLCGCGYSYDPQQVTHFYDKEVRDARWGMDPKHAILLREAQRRGISIFNVVSDGYISPVYPAISAGDFHRMLLPENETWQAGNLD